MKNIKLFEEYNKKNTFESKKYDLNKIAYVITPEKDLASWTIYFYKKGNVTGGYSGYGKDGLKEKLEEFTDDISSVPIIYGGELDVKFLLKNNNKDVNGVSDLDNNLTNEEYIKGLLKNGGEKMDIF